MNKLVFITIVILLMMGGCCKRFDCSQCSPVYKPEIIMPTFACHKPVNYVELQKQFISTVGIKTEGELLEVITTNAKMQEKHIASWQNYAVCVETTVENYENLKDKMGSNDGE